jgi:hypothetical protein
MSCKFDENICTVSCKKYPICSYYSIQNQFIKIQSQLNFIYNTITQILKSEETTDTKIILLEEAIRSKVDCTIDDSEKILLHDEKESKHEKEN